MLPQPKSTMTLGRGAGIVLVEGLGASRLGCNAAVRGRFPTQWIKLAPPLFQEGRGEWCKLRGLSEIAAVKASDRWNCHLSDK